MESRDLRSDELLCGLAAAGDNNAEECLAARYSRLVRICARPYFLAGGDSEDLLQEGMIGLLSAIRGYDPERGGSFQTYAEVCIRNRLRSAVRMAGREKYELLNRSVSLEIPLYDEIPHPRQEHYPLAESPEEMLIGREEWEGRLETLKVRLSGFEREVLESYLEGLSYAEIAGQTGKPLKSVDNAVQRIRRKAEPFFSSGDISVS